MKIAIWGRNSSDSYSGGRIHAWLMAEALADNNHSVTYFTDNKPVFYNEFSNFKKHDKIEIKINKWFLFDIKKEYFDIIFLIPHLKSPKSFIFDPYFFYRSLTKLKKINSCKIIKLDFESPNWITSVIPESRKVSDFIYQNKFDKNVDGILSSTQLGMGYAQKYYKSFNSNMHFDYCMPCINSIAADEVLDPNKQDKITIITRFNDLHKNPIKISDILFSNLKGYIINIIMGRGSMNSNDRKLLLAKAKKINCKINFLHAVTEKEKFLELKKSKLVLFFTKFEGFGLPPIEAQYCGTKCIASDIPVLKEVNNDQISYIDNNNISTIQESINKIINDKYDPNELKRKITNIASFNHYSQRLQKSLNYFIKS